MIEFATLLKAARNLDRNALAAIFDTYSPALYKFISRLGHDPVASDQIVAEVFLQLVTDLRAGDGPRINIRSYLYQIAYHRVRERTRDLQPFASLEVALPPPERARPAKTPSRTEEQALLESLLSTMNTELSEDQRIVIILRFLEEFSLKETAEIIGKDANNVKVIQSRGIAKLQKALGMQIEEE